MLAQFKFPKDGLQALADCLLLADQDFRLLLVINKITAPTEQDIVSKSLVGFYTYHSNCKNILQTFAAVEIQACLQENTIFRNNSIASRMFKYYSKVLGIPFLFHTLARFIVELNTLAQTNTKDAKSKAHSFLSMDVRTLVYFSLIQFTNCFVDGT